MRLNCFVLVLAAVLLVLPATGFVNAEETQDPTIVLQEGESINNDSVEPEITDALTIPEKPNTCEARDNAPEERISNVCGACSVLICRGAIRGTMCGAGKYCIPVNTLPCPGSEDWDCSCARNYN